MITPRRFAAPSRRRIPASLLALLGALLLPTGAFALDHSGAINSPETWHAADNPHVVVSNVSLATGVVLTLEDGVEVRFNGNTRIDAFGSIQAIGTTGQGITLDRDTGSDWYGLRFYTNGGGNFAYCSMTGAAAGFDMTGTGPLSLDHVTITDGGTGVQCTGGTLALTSLHIDGMSADGLYLQGVTPQFLDAATLIENCVTGLDQRNVSNIALTSAFTIRGTTDAGLYLNNCPGATVNNVVFESCGGTRGAIWVENNGTFTLGAGNSIGGTGVACSWPLTIDPEAFPDPGCVIPTTGNTNNAIQVRSGNGDRTGTWPAFAGLDYVVTVNATIATAGNLTLGDGVTVRFNGNTRFDVFGTLNAAGSSGQGVTLDRNTGSDWYGLRFYTSAGGSFAYCSMNGAAAGFDSNSAGALTMDHVTITDGGTGVQCSGGTLALTSLHIDGMSADGLYLQGVTPQFLDAATLIENCVTGLDQRNVSNIALTSAFTIRGTTDAGLYLNNCPGATVNNVVFESCGGTRGAIWVENNGTFTLGAGNSIGGTGVACSWPLTIDPEAFPDPGCVIPTTGNTNNAIQVRSGNGDRTGSWPAFAGLDYVVTVNATIATAGNLTLGDGVTVRFNGNTRFDVFGTLNAAGSSGQGVTLDRNTGSDWYGLRFYTSAGGSFAYCSMTGAAAGFDSNSAGALTMDHVTITDGGTGVQCSGGTLTLTSLHIDGMSADGLYLQGVTPQFLDAATLIENCVTGLDQRNVSNIALTSTFTIRGTTDAGLYLNNCPGATVDNVVFESCGGTRGAIWVENNGSFTLGAGNSIGGTGVACSWPLTIDPEAFPDPGCVIPTTGNTNNAIQVRSGNGDRTGTWPAFAGLDYVVTVNATIATAGNLTLGDGVTVRFNGNTRFDVFGTLNAAGTAGQGVTLDRNTGSDWYGLRFYTSGGGNFAYCSMTGAAAGFDVNGAGTLMLDHVTVTDGGYGIQSTTGALTLRNCRVFDNSTYGVYLGGGTMSFGIDPDQWNDIYDNGGGTAGRNLRNGPSDLTAAFVYWGSTDHATIKAGITDQEDNASLGLVTVTPFLNANHQTEGTGVDDPELPDGALPVATALFQNHPNPFNPTTTLRFDLKTAGPVRLEIFDLKGARVATLLDGPLPAGHQQVTWRGTDDAGHPQASGVYLYRLEADGLRAVRRMTLVR